MEKVFASIRSPLEISVVVAHTSQSPVPMCKSFRYATTFAHRLGGFHPQMYQSVFASRKPSTHLRIGKIPFQKQSFWKELRQSAEPLRVIVAEPHNRQTNQQITEIKS
ncbi:hypothetical protein [Epilithonimonas vandammei]|uniref:Uncharacterized protein n=1 Tax=Epilithonimonas vandammei TaxID=2487072 RepID=A0A3G8Y3V5_9FLAO|nr:hypothetical protein [Epilithonimonas vandammei]AZI39740.1 hypothetical protein EIB74_07105 [Epilithonimonas vandammei]